MEDTDKLISELKKAGFHDKAAIVYAHLLTLGGAYPSRLAEVTKLNRSTVYKILLELSVKGLVNEIERGKKLYYQVDRPAKLLRYAKQQIDTANDRYESVQKLYPEIEGLFSMLPNKPKIFYFEGAEGIMSVYDDHLAVTKPYEMVGFADTNEVLKFLPENYFKKYRAEKQRKKITSRGIFPEGKEYEDYATETYGDVSKEIQPGMRFIPKAKFPFRGEMTIYGTDKVSIINLNATQPLGLIIEDASFHRMMRVIFDLAWNGIGK